MPLDDVDLNFILTDEGIDVPTASTAESEIPEDFLEDDDSDIEVSEEDDVDEAKMLVFNLDNIPGAEHQEDLPAEIEVEEEPDEIEVEEQDPWDWRSLGLGKFLPWLHGMLTNIPGHSGYDTAGLERAIAYFEALDKEISKAMRMDFKNEIDVAKAEEAREQIEKGLERLVDRLEKVKTTRYKRHKKKKADLESNLTKTAQKASGVEGRVRVTVPLLISGLARTCINGTVAHGRDIEDSYGDLVKKYSLNEREQAEMAFLLMDMGYPIRRPRDSFGDDVDPYSNENIDWNQNFPG